MKPHGQRAHQLGKDLPQLSSCGPIEAYITKSALLGQMAFRNYQVAAPLKRNLRAPYKVVKYLPQLSSCGPIEAAACSRAARPRPSLPQLSSCGPIEAHSVVAHVLAQGISLPQLSSCGPIEADGTGAQRRYGSAFRNYQVAAPLKPEGASDNSALSYLPQLSSCGPIEASISQRLPTC